MQMPTTFTDDLYGRFGDENPDGSPIRPRAYSLVFPPVGFIPFWENGFGGSRGFYWPIGKELEPPIVAMSVHEAYSLVPENGDADSPGRREIANRDEIVPEDDEPEANVSRVPVDDHRQWLALDPTSPFRNCAVADLDIVAEDFASAAARYRAAIERLPEYGAAHFGLGYLLRRLRQPEEAAVHLRRALICPFAFWGTAYWAQHQLPGEFRNDGARKALMWLQKTGTPDASLRDDPFLQSVGQLTLETGTARSHDLELLISLVEVYFERGEMLDAIYIWLTVGDRAAFETTSFRERYNLTPRTWSVRLSELLQAAGNERRATLLDSMLSAMREPDGLHL